MKKAILIALTVLLPIAALAFMSGDTVVTFLEPECIC